MTRQKFTEMANYLNEAWRAYLTEDELRDSVDYYVADYAYSLEKGELCGSVKALAYSLLEDADNGSAESKAYYDMLTSAFC